MLLSGVSLLLFGQFGTTLTNLLDKSMSQGMLQPGGSSSTSSVGGHSQQQQSHHSHSSSPNAPIPTAPFVEPPPLFAAVAPQIYRSATPTASSHAFLRSLQLKTVLSLTAELPSAGLKNFCRKEGIRFLHIADRRWTHSSDDPALPTGRNQDKKVKSNSDVEHKQAAEPISLAFLHAHKPASSANANTTSSLSEEVIKDSLQVLLNSALYHPILVTDTAGIHEVGVLLGCLRKLQRWNFATILLEYRNFAGNRARSTNERFIEMFDTDLITFPDKEVLPSWFSEQLDADEAELDRLEGHLYEDS